MITTAGQALFRVRAKAYGAQRIELDRIANDIVADALTFALTFGTGEPAYASVLSVGAESMFVWAYDTTTKIVDVTRGWNGTKAQAWSAGTEVELNARFPSPEILNEMRDEIQGWPQTLYRVASFTHTIAAAPGSIQLNPELAGCYGLIDVRRMPDPFSGTTGTTWARVNQVELVRQMDPDSFATGDMLSINESLPRSSTSLRVIAAMPFDTSTEFTPTTDLVQQIGLAPSMVDLAVLGTAIRLIMPQEIKRSSRAAADEPRIAGEVTPGLALQTGAGLLRVYNERMQSEAAKLAARYPIRFT